MMMSNSYPEKPRHFDASWKVACSILDYFDSYKVGSVAPIAAEIEKAMDAVYQDAVNATGRQGVMA